MEQLAPELVVFFATLGVLETQEVLELSLCSKRVFNILLGNEWAKSHIFASKGLKWCCRYGTVTSVSLCLRDPQCDPKANQSECLRTACQYNPEAVCLLLKDGRADPTVYHSSSLRIAAEHQPEAVRYLLEDGRADPSDYLSTCLKIACCHQPEAVRLLLEDGRADPLTFKSVSLRLACEHQPEAVRFLLEDGRIDPSDPVYLLLAIEHQPEAVRWLLEDDRVDPQEYRDACVRLATKEWQSGVLRLLLKDGRFVPNCPKWLLKILDFCDDFIVMGFYHYFLS